MGVCKAKHSSYVYHRHYINHKWKTPIINPRRKIWKEPAANESLGFDVTPAPLYWKLLLKRQHKLQKHSKNANRKQSWCNERPEDKKDKFAESKCDAYHQWNYMNKFTVDSQIWMCIWLIQSWFYPDACGVMQKNSTFLIALICVCFLCKFNRLHTVQILDIFALFILLICLNSLSYFDFDFVCACP